VLAENMFSTYSLISIDTTGLSLLTFFLLDVGMNNHWPALKPALFCKTGVITRDTLDREVSCIVLQNHLFIL